ncbi:MAG: class I SAM-dependent methyltransferase [Planctomycetota bacterium]
MSVKEATFTLLRPLFGALDAGQLRKLRTSGGEDGACFARVAGRLEKLEDDGSEDLQRIEAHRRTILGREGDPLVDGSLGEPRPWDVGFSVADACRDSKKPRPALLLYWLIREFRPKRVLEIGTNVGISAACISAALRANGDGGSLVTVDGSAYRQRIAKDTIETLGMSDLVTFEFGSFADVLDDVLERHGPFDCAFIDGNHKLDPTLDYTNRLIDLAPAGPLLVYDDVRWSPGMKEAWRRLRDDERMQMAADLYSMGVCRMERAPATQRVVTKPMLSVLYGPAPAVSA